MADGRPILPLQEFPDDIGDLHFTVTKADSANPVPLFLNDRAMVIDAALLRSEAADGSAGTVLKIEYSPSGSAMAANNVVVGTWATTLDNFTTTPKGATIDKTKNVVPANAIVYLSVSQATAGAGPWSVSIRRRSRLN